MQTANDEKENACRRKVQSEFSFQIGNQSLQVKRTTFNIQ